ncbi:MAG: hypothetical protein KME13_03595 [Myxacorys californica WJT36-NPBG1]|nr:hypothetical protein [Myxacorys californica WJT36-NPBG1]
MRNSLRSSVFLASLLASTALAASDTIAADPVPSSIRLTPLQTTLGSPSQLNPSPLGPLQLPSGTPSNSLGATQDPLRTQRSPDFVQPNSNPQIRQKEADGIPQVRQRQIDETPQVRQKDQDPFQLPPRRRQPQPKIRRYEPTPTGAVGGIRGQVTVKPICSVVSVTDCVARPYVGTLNVVSLDRTQRVRIRTDNQGEFQLQLLEGIYIIEPETGSFPALSQRTVRIVSGAIREEEFAFDSYVRDAEQPGSSSQTVRQAEQRQSSSF